MTTTRQRLDRARRYQRNSKRNPKQSAYWHGYADALEELIADGHTVEHLDGLIRQHIAGQLPPDTDDPNLPNQSHRHTVRQLRRRHLGGIIKHLDELKRKRTATYVD